MYLDERSARARAQPALEATGDHQALEEKEPAEAADDDAA
jgi:hypothetical protein